MSNSQDKDQKFSEVTKKIEDVLLAIEAIKVGAINTIKDYRLQQLEKLRQEELYDVSQKLKEIRKKLSNKE